VKTIWKLSLKFGRKEEYFSIKIKDIWAAHVGAGALMSVGNLYCKTGVKFIGYVMEVVFIIMFQVKISSRVIFSFSIEIAP